MFVLFEEENTFKTARILSETDTSLHVELTSGRRHKIKMAHVILKFQQPSADDFLSQAQALHASIDIAFLWECAPPEEFDFISLAKEYFSASASPLEQAAILLSVHSAPAYFHRRGKGKYRAAPPEILQAALQAIEKKQRQLEQQSLWVKELCQFNLPIEIAKVASTFLHKPDKNSLEWKAFDQACQELQTTKENLLLKLHVFSTPLSIHLNRFFTEYFPKGTDIPEQSIPSLELEKYPLCEQEVFSIDNLSTTEIDDALSLTRLDNGHYRLGVHIAVPALGIDRDTPLDQTARHNMATLYLPGIKFTMQHTAVSDTFSLDEGLIKPCISLYAEIDTINNTLISTHSSIERVAVTRNLRSEDLDPLITEAALSDEQIDIPHGQFFRGLWACFLTLNHLREVRRGKPERNHRVDFSFNIIGDPCDPTHSRVTISQRLRDAPLDKMVGEFMILANSTWAAMQAHSEVPAIYRSQHLGRVKTSTYPGGHDAMGVEFYAWHTSPLRRYVDLVNQRQLISTIEHGVSARLVAPFKPKDADLYAIITQFESRYSAYQEFQQQIEFFWCLRYLQQEELLKTPIQAFVVKENLIRFESLPIYTRLLSLPELEPGSHILIEVITVDELALTLEARFLEVIQNDDEALQTEMA